MSRLTSLRRQVIGFFVDDALLGVGTVLTVAVAALCRELLRERPLVAGAVLLAGCLTALTLSVARGASARLRRPRRPSGP